MNPESQILQVFERVADVEAPRCALLAVHSGDEVVRAAPFAAHGVDVRRKLDGALRAA